MQLWTQFLAKQERAMGKTAVDRWLRPLKILRFDARNIYLEAPDRFHVEWFHEQAAEIARREFRSNGHPIKIHLSIEAQENKKKENQPKVFFSSDHIESQATFEDYVMGENHLPCQLLKELSEGSLQESEYNPIFLYGPSGSGKSHLLMATAHRLKERGMRPFYIKAETFTKQVIDAYRESSLHHFRKTYRESEILIVDDVHLLEGKAATQEELFHTFNTLHIAKKQLILSANCSPRELQKIEERLKSRFEWGLALPLYKPTEKMLIEMVQKRAERFDFTLNRSVVSFLIANFYKPHDLLRSVEALALRCESHPPSTPEEAERILRDLLAHEQKLKLTPSKIIDEVAAYFQLTSEDLLGKSQSKEHALPRHLAVYLCREKLNTPYLSLKNLFGRDHSTLISSVKKVTKAKEENLTDWIYPLEKIEENLPSA